MDKIPFGPVPWDILVFVALTGTGFALSVQRYAQSLNLTRSNDRALASPTEKNHHPKTLELGCLEKRLLTERRESYERDLRLMGQFCHLSTADMHQFGGLRVRNLTTGQESTIFFQGYANTFLTDSLVLAEGPNRIRLEWRESPDAPERELTAEIVAR